MRGNMKMEGTIELGVGSRESGVRSRESGVGSQESGVGSQESGVGSRASGVGSEFPMVSGVLLALQYTQKTRCYSSPFTPHVLRFTYHNSRL